MLSLSKNRFVIRFLSLVYDAVARMHLEFIVYTRAGLIAI